eukprot:TRINITY_DN2881_c0_g1_i2.p1 TRINITY_DN2881_c0_g1~~TRINITY_DN2881_c0_g1_i2.p1  ORF type:complete len:490 (+),score=111.38 TRINITY_DN2881_c0_g1_i2:60-1529(+)
MARSLNKVLLLTLIGALALATSTNAHEVEIEGPSDVVVLTQYNFNTVLGENDLVLVKFFVPWCGHCKSMKGDYKLAATELKSLAVLADVDCTVEQELASEYGIQGFPTLKLFQKGALVSDYRGRHTKAALVEFVMSNVQPATTKLSSEAEVQEFIGKSGTVVISLSSDATEAAGFEAVARELRETVPNTFFAQVDNGDLFAKAGGEAGKKIVVRSNGEVSSTSDTADLANFIVIQSLPLVGSISGETAALYQRANLGLFLAFIDESKDNAATLETLRAVATATRGKLSAVTADGIKFARFMEHMGLKGDLPQWGIHHMSKDENHPYSGATDADSLTAWAQTYIKGELKVKLKSEAIPETQDEAVVKVVGDSWNDVVMNSDKDVLVEQYAPWCGHCKTLAPIYEELAQDLASVGTVTIAKMDATVNDAPTEYKARSFPTIHFFPAGANKKGVPYKGGRTKADFIKFLTENATHKFDLSADSQQADARDEL